MQAIVLRTTRYGDNALIVDLYTREQGRMSLITSSVRKRKHPESMSLWKPMTILQIQAEEHTTGKRLPRVKEATHSYIYHELPYSPIKASIAIFLAEFLCAALREEGQNTPLYTFIETSLLWLDTAEHTPALANYHIIFITQLSRYIGIWPNTTPNGPYFDLQAATYTPTPPPHPYLLNPDEARYMRPLFNANYANMHHLHFTQQARVRILNVFNTYFRLHIPTFPQLRSVAVLHELFAPVNSL